jgi:hypothetical protein
MSFSVPTGKPGVQPTTYTTTPRTIFYGQQELAMYLPFPITIDGTASSNPQNAPYIWLLWAGMFLGQETSSGKFATSIIGNTSQTLGGGQTTLYTDPNTAQEIVRRIGTSGTFNLTGGTVPNGPASGVRTVPITYSAVTQTNGVYTGAITITATDVPPVAAAAQVNSLVIVDNTGSGNFTITVGNVTTPAIAYSATAATLVTNINAQTNIAFGTDVVIAAGASLATITLTLRGNLTDAVVLPVYVTGSTLTGATVNGQVFSGSAATQVAPVSTVGTPPATTAPVYAVNSIPFVDTTGSGTFNITVEGVTTGAITYSATAATLVTNINVALQATFGPQFVCSGASLAAVILTAAGAAYAPRPLGLVQATVLTGSTGYTINGSGTIGTPSTCAVTTTGVSLVQWFGGSGSFVAGSLIQPTDGSQVIKTILTDQFGTKVIDQLNTTRVDVFDALLWAGGGVIDCHYLVNYPTDTGIQAYIKAQVRSFIGQGIFSDDYIGA